MIWQIHELIGLIISSFALGWFVKTKLGWLEAIALIYFLLSAAFLFQHPEPRWGDVQFRIDTSSAIAYLSIFGITWVALASKDRDLVFKIFEWAIVINCLIIWFVGWGMFNSHSADTAIMAFMLPIFFRDGRPGKFRTSAVAFAVATILFHSGSTAIVVLIAQAWVYAFTAERNRKLPIISGLIGGALGFLTTENFLNSSYRVQEWARFMTWWFENASPILGAGIGSFYWLGPSMQDGKVGYFTFMHNDLLQILFEAGAIGIILFGAVVCKGIKHAFGRPWLVCSMVGVLVCSLTQYPFHFFSSQLFIAITYLESTMGGEPWKS